MVMGTMGHTHVMEVVLKVWIVAVMVVMRGSQSDARLDSPENVNNRAITELLNSLLVNYNKHLRPNFGGDPIEVQTNILIRSVGPVSEEQMMFSMDCYFRQQWIDERLAFNATEGIDVLRPSIKMLDKIWKPDTFFLNGQDSYVHKITYVNKFLRINNTGRLYYSQRLTIKSTCPMRLQKYPLDKQMCPLYVGSYGYAESDMNLVWSEGGKAVSTTPDITIAQFLLIEPINYDYRKLGISHGNRTVLYVEFQLQREIGYYLLQIYLPCYLIVIISWVSFWINREATPARVTLGITTLLTTCTIAITGREGIPKVSYSTALDIFLLMCFSFVFAALVEYAGVNYFTKGIQREGPTQENDSEEEEANTPLLMATQKNNSNTTSCSKTPNSQHPITTDANGHTVLGGVAKSSPSNHSDSCLTMFLHCLKGNAKYRNYKMRTHRGSLSVSKIDSLARIIFPFSFTCLNILYWAGFLYYFKG